MTDAAKTVMDQARRLREGIERGVQMEKIERLSAICRMLGCSGINSECPGNEQCEILQKVIGKGGDDDDDGGPAGVGGGADCCA